MKRGPSGEGPLFISLARPERFELPTFWFVGRNVVVRFFGNQSLAALAIVSTCLPKAQLGHIQSPLAAI